MSSRAPILLLAVAAALAAPRAAADDRPAVAGDSRPTADEALALLFPGCLLARETVYLTESQRARVADLAQASVASAVVQRASAWKDGKLAGCAYVDTHRVRTLKETLLVGVDPTGRVLRVECLAFAEPALYAPRAGFYAQFQGKALGPDLSLKRDIRTIGGATLSARATTDAVRRSLAIDAVLRRDAPPRPPPPRPSEPPAARGDP
jgi:hypothetical protein